MGSDDVKDVLRRAAEAGYFDREVLAYLEAPQTTREEARAYWALYRRAWDLVGPVELPTFEVVAHDAGTGAALLGTRVVLSSSRFRDHLEHSQFAELVPESLRQLTKAPAQ